MENTKRILSGTRLNRLRAQGFTSQNDYLLSDMAFGIRFAYRVCFMILIVAIAMKSTVLFMALLGIAFFGIFLPNHPFDYVYNHILRNWMGKSRLPARPRQFKFVCGIATVWLSAVVYLMTSGFVPAGLIMAGIVMIMALLTSTIDICVPSMIYNAIFQYKKKFPGTYQLRRSKFYKQKGKNIYPGVVRHSESLPHFAMGMELAERLGYPGKMLTQLPGKAIESFAGVGYYFDLANITNGERVVDLGCGSGTDLFFAATLVGKTGHVTGIDMTTEQLEKVTELKDQFQFDQVSLQKSNIENLPLASGSMDAVISNGIINLSHQKEMVFKEASRILKRGGRMAFADIVSSVPLPENVSSSATLWAACIGGAMQKEEYRKIIKEAGLTIIKEKVNPYEFLSVSAKNVSRTFRIQSISMLAVKK